MDPLGRFFQFQLELEEKIVVDGCRDESVRNYLAISRGHLELARDHGEPLKTESVEKPMVLVAEHIGTSAWRHPFLVQLRTIAAWAQVSQPAAA